MDLAVTAVVVEVGYDIITETNNRIDAINTIKPGEKRNNKKTGQKFKGKGETKDKGKEQTDHKIGENGVPIPGSKTVAQNGSTERVDIENPNPGKGNGNMHYHEPNNTKWYYDFYQKIFTYKNGEPAPPKIQKLLKLDWIRKAIKKGKKLLGE